MVETGKETDSEQLLSKYLVLHCAKLHLTVTDAASGKHLPSLGSLARGGTSHLMAPILRVNVQNQMYYEDLNLMQMFQVSEHSRYLFLEFVKSFSLVVVANQGGYDLHVFRLATQLDQAERTENVKM